MQKVGKGLKSMIDKTSTKGKNPGHKKDQFITETMLYHSSVLCYTKQIENHIKISNNMLKSRPGLEVARR